MKQGSILLELLIASAIGAFVGVMIFSTFSQTSKALQVSTDFADMTRSVFVLGNLFERELSGVRIPYQRVEKKEEKKPTKKEDKDTKKKTQKEPVLSPDERTEKKPRKKYEYIPLEKAFYSENKDGNLSLLSFITINPLPAFKHVKSRLARVEYTLEPDRDIKRKKGVVSFKLYRRESPILTFDAFEKAKKKPLKFEVCKNIKSFTTEYITARRREKGGEEKEEEEEEEEKEAEKDREGDEKEVEIDYKTFTQWKGRQIIGKDKKGKEIKRSCPSFYILRVELWDEQLKRTDKFEFKVE